MVNSTFGLLKWRITSVPCSLDPKWRQHGLPVPLHAPGGQQGRNLLCLVSVVQVRSPSHLPSCSCFNYLEALGSLVVLTVINLLGSANISDSDLLRAMPSKAERSQCLLIFFFFFACFWIALVLLCNLIETCTMCVQCFWLDVGLRTSKRWDESADAGRVTQHGAALCQQTQVADAPCSAVHSQPLY